MNIYKEYNPLDYDNLTANLVRELMSRDPLPLPLPERFEGPGVYALFYNGDFEDYSELTKSTNRFPIYAGKAVPEGSRKGLVDKSKTTHALHKRLSEHVKSINEAQNLKVEDFTVRFLVVTPLWITMAERFLIEHFSPIWNQCIDGFGNHHPGKGRTAGEVSYWDFLHPGRPWAKQLRQTRKAEVLKAKIESHWQHFSKLEIESFLK